MNPSGLARQMPAVAKANVALLALLAGALVWRLWPEWTRDPDMSHGLLAPLACVLLLAWGRRSDGRDALASGLSTALTLVLAAAALAFLATAGLLAASLDWDSQIVEFMLSAGLASLCAGAVAAFSDRRSSFVGFSWPTLACAPLVLLSSPLPPGTYTRLTLGLQLGVSSGVVRTLDLLGVAAHREGNIIELARGTVGVEEACSGVRSLVSCAFAAVLFSATLVRRPGHRALLLAVCAPLALAMNFLRSLALTLLVNAGVRIEGALHDATGYAVLAATAGLLVGLALRLASREGAPPAEGAPVAAGAPGAPQWILACGCVASIALCGVFAGATRAPVRAAGGPPNLLALLPEKAPGWTVATADSLYRFSGTLRTDDLAQRTYSRADARGRVQVTLYVAYWPPGAASVGRVGSHTPDACWPGSGWQSRSVPSPQVTLSAGGRTVAPAQYRLFQNGDYPQHVWYWQLYAGRPVDVGGTHSVSSLVRIALRFGIRQGGEQAFVRISSNRPWEELSAEPFIAQFIGALGPLGLYAEPPNGS